MTEVRNSIRVWRDNSIIFAIKHSEVLTTQQKGDAMKELQALKDRIEHLEQEAERYDDLQAEAEKQKAKYLRLAKAHQHTKRHIKFWKWVSENYCYSQIKSKLEGKAMYYHISNQAPTKYYTEAELREEFKRLKG